MSAMTQTMGSVRPLLLAFAALVGAGACASQQESRPSGSRVAGFSRVAFGKVSYAPAGPTARGRIELGPPQDVALPFELKTIPGGRALLAVASTAGQSVAWARKIDGATGEMGPILRLVDERVAGAFEAGDALSLA